eukprot:1577089-Prymnesium_polylepis.2
MSTSILAENARLHAENAHLRHENSRLQQQQQQLPQPPPPPLPTTAAGSQHHTAARHCFDAQFLRDALQETESQLAVQRRITAAQAEEVRQAAVREAAVIAELPAAEQLLGSSSGESRSALETESRLRSSLHALSLDLQETEGLLAAEQRLTNSQAEEAREAAVRQAAVVSEMIDVERLAAREAAANDGHTTGTVIDRGGRRHEGASTTGGTDGVDTEATAGAER